MGIQSLSSFVSKIEGLRKPYQLRDTLVVIDGNNLMYYMYMKFSQTNDIDFIFGGNYIKLRQHFDTFFKSLSKCQITPIIVFDGGLSTDLEESRRKRFEESFQRSKNLSAYPTIVSQDYVKTNDIIFPYLLRRCFISLAIETNITCFQTREDPDLDIGKLANELKCPVISNDSDFLVMTIDGGVISCDSFNWQDIKTPKDKDNKHYIECKIYRVLEFVDHFGLKPELLSIFASLMGNDRISDESLKFMVIDLVNDVSIVSTNDSLLNGLSSERMDRMNILLHWLSKRFFSATQAEEFIVKYLKNNGIDDKQFVASLRSYESTKKTFLKQLFDYKNQKTRDEDIPIDEMIGDKRIPKWFLLEHFSCQLDSILFGFIDRQLFYMRPLVEDFTLESCFECSYDLNGFLLGLLRISSEDKSPVRMLIRKDKTFEDNYLKPKIHLTHIGGEEQELPLLVEIRNYSDIWRKNLLFRILGISENWINDLNEKLLLLKIDGKDIDFWLYFSIVVKCWKQKTKLYLRDNYFRFVRALVLSVIYNRHQSLVGNDFGSLMSVTKQLFKPHITHYFCEFQVLYSTANKLVSLLGYPIKSVELCNYLNGTLYYNLFEEILANRLDFYAFKEQRLNTLNTFIVGSLCES